MFYSNVFPMKNIRPYVMDASQCCPFWRRAATIGVLLFTAVASGAPPFSAPPGTVRTSWVGNSLGGAGGGNGEGYWVQNAADEIDVSPDGTVFAGVSWDEGGR